MVNPTNDRRLVIVGACLAGLRAAEAARRSGHDGPITLVGAEEHLPYDRPPLSKAFLDDETPPVPTYREEQVLRDELGVDLRLSTTATGLDTADRRVLLDRGDVGYDALVIATGAHARTLPGSASLAGLHVLRTIDDARAVRRALDEGARTVVVGAGFIGSEVASGARKRGLPVTIVEMATTPLVRSVGSAIGSALADLHRIGGSDLRLGMGVESVLGRSKVTGVRLTDGTELPADLVVVGAGAAPSTSWLEGSGVALHPRDRGLMCDETLNTGIEGVYGAGDVAHWRNALFGCTMRLEHWTSAAEQGALAARNALGPESAKPYETVPYFWSDWYDNRIQFVGISDSDEIHLVGSVESGKFIALYRGDDRVVGALTVNQPRMIMKFRKMIAKRADWREAIELAAPATP